MQPEKSNARKTALQILLKCEAGQYSNLALDAALKKSDLAEDDKGLVTVLVYGVLEKKITLDWLISHLSNRPLDGMDGEVLMICRLGIYQLRFLDRIPNHAAVNETVALASAKTKGFVNAILRNYLRNGEQIAFPDAAKEPIRYLSVVYSVSFALCELFLSQFGFARTESLLHSVEQAPSLTLRINQNRISREEYLTGLQRIGIAAEPTKEAPFGIQLKTNGNPVLLPGFADGWFFVQDEASQLCVQALDVHPGMRVLDVCACPGSKSFGLCLNMNDRGTLLACDLHASKLSLVRDGGRRLGISILDVMQRDAREPLPGWEQEENKADRILCDVPCSGFGVFAKKPELRYKNPQDSENLPAIQSAILSRSGELLKTGGKLVYSTCTLLERENHAVVKSFLERHPEFSLLSERTLFPDTDGTDGFYYAVLQKSTESEVNEHRERTEQ